MKTLNSEFLVQTLQLIFLQPLNLLLIVVGMLLGLIFGALPGISSSMGIILMIPFTYYLAPVPSIILLVAVYAGAAYGGSITAILFNTPGNPGAVATTFDGYPMTKNGKGGKALGFAISASAFGGIFSAIIMLLFAPSLSKVALKIQSAEYFALTLLGIATIASIGSKNLAKALIMACLGIVIALIGMDPMAGVTRMTFGKVELLSGVPFIPIMIGAFALAEVLKQVMTNITQMSKDEIAQVKNVNLETTKLSELFSYYKTLFKSSLIGTLIGILPGTGGSIASIVSYGEAVRSDKNPDKFGKGAPEGVIAPESANNAAAGGAMIPTLVLGIPGSPATTIILSALILQGLQPGPQLMKEQPLMLYAIFFSMLIASILVFFGGKFGVKAFASLLKLPYKFLAPFILMFSILGSFAIANNVFHIWIMIISGIVGYFMKIYDFSPASLILGLVLGSMMEENFRRQLLITNGDFSSFFTRPISLALLLAILAILMYPVVSKKLSKKTAQVAK